MVSLSRLTESLLLTVDRPLSAVLPSASLPSSLELFVRVGFVRAEFAGDAVTGGGREY